MILTKIEKKTIMSLFPDRSSFDNLLIMESIFEKIRISNLEPLKFNQENIDFSQDEKLFMQSCVAILDRDYNLPFECLSIAKKIRSF